MICMFLVLIWILCALSVWVFTIDLHLGIFAASLSIWATWTIGGFAWDMSVWTPRTMPWNGYDKDQRVLFDKFNVGEEP